MGSPLVQFWNGAQLTDWIDGSVPPLIVGVYLRDYSATPAKRPTAMSLWDGAKWHSQETNPEAAAGNPAVSPWQQLPWRGLARDPALCAPCEGLAA